MTPECLIGRGLGNGGRTLSLSGVTIPAGLAIPAGVEALYLSWVTIPAGLAIPAGVEALYLGGATIPAGFAIPAGVETLYLSGATIPAGFAIPAGVETLYLSGVTIPAGLAIPAGVRTLGLNRAEVTDGGHYTCPRGYTLYSLPLAAGGRVFWAGCRQFGSADAALAHWGSDQYPDIKRGTAFCDAIRAAMEPESGAVGDL